MADPIMDTNEYSKNEDKDENTKVEGDYCSDYDAKSRNADDQGVQIRPTKMSKNMKWTGNSNLQIRRDDDEADKKIIFF